MALPNRKQRIIDQLREMEKIIKEYADDPDNMDLFKTACECWNIALGKRFCPFCGTDEAVEAQMFEGDKFFKYHSCRGMI